MADHGRAQENRKRRSPGRKVRNLSRVFADMPFLNSLTGRSPDELQEAQSFSRKSKHAHSHKVSLGRQTEKAPSLQNLGPTHLELMRSQSTASARSYMMLDTPPRSITLPDLGVGFEVDLQSPTLTVTSTSTPGSSHRPHHPSPENIPLPPSRAGSLRGSNKVLKKRRRQSLDILQSDEFGVKALKLPRSRSLRFNPSSLSKISRTLSSRPSIVFHPSPTSVTTNSDDDRNDEPPLSAEQHYREVRRARKMTKLFGQELPPELLRLKDDRRHADFMQHRNDSNASSILGSTPTTPVVDEDQSLEAPSEEGHVQSGILRPSSRSQHGTRSGFQERRRRITKLTQFFGVDHSEIASSVAMFTQRDSQDDELENGHNHGVDSRVASPEHGRAHAHLPITMDSTGVGVKIVNRRLWRMSEEKQDVDMNDVISKLRGLKAS